LNQSSDKETNKLFTKCK